MYLAYRNREVDDANEVALARFGRRVCLIPAHHDVRQSTGSDDTQIDATTRRQLLQEAVEMMPENAKFLPRQLNIAIGVPTVLTCNIEQRLGLCNGSRGVVYDIITQTRDGTNQPIVLVQMENYNGPSYVEGVRSIIPITSHTVSLTSKDQSPFKITRTALPLRLGFAKTIHKIQGQTCHRVILNPVRLSSSALAYVALSHVRSRDDFYLTTPLLLDQVTKSLQAKEIAAEEDSRLHRLSAQTREQATRLAGAMKTIALLYNRDVEQSNLV